MSVKKTIKEYLEVVRNGIVNGDKIIEALRVSAQLKEIKDRQEEGISTDDIHISDEAIAEIMRRKDLCAGCEFNSENRKKITNYSSSLGFTHCTLCKCRIGYEDSKEYCLSCECGMAAWNKRNPELPQMKLKWEAFKENKTEKK